VARLALTFTFAEPFCPSFLFSEAPGLRFSVTVWFFFVTFAVADGAAVNQKLLKQGVIVRPIGGYGLPNHLRVTIGLPEENERFLAALEKTL
jgi:histidinol-phosphate/aromatic aminotransferase/cobyric acid decarboxylase-like protein